MATPYPAPKLGADPGTVGYYGVAERDGKVTLLWAERVRTPGGPMPTRAAGQWWLAQTYRSVAAGMDACGALNRNMGPGGSTPPEQVEAWAGPR